ncbi:MAG: hypothetical protein AB8H47_14690 [Bacteroidia bacterium]
MYPQAFVERMQTQLGDEYPAFEAALTRESAVSLSWEDAIQYLRREPFKTQLPNGWALLKYQDITLGWIKQIGHRANNYYPQDWRIRMAKPADKPWTLA